MVLNKKPTNAAEAMEEAAKVYKERQEQYGNSYKAVGQIMQILFPGGLPGNLLNHTRLHLVGWIVGKLCRYAVSIRSGREADDSLKDLAVYAMMLYCEENNNGN